jgi:Ca2+-binding RTX toxin-like protein
MRAGTGLLDDLLYLIAHSPTVTYNNSRGTAVINQDYDDGYNHWDFVRFAGTDLDSQDGVIRTMSYAHKSLGVDVEYQFRIDGLHVNSADFLAAIDLARQNDTSGLKAIFKGLDWSYTSVGSSAETFEGTGGDDMATLGKGNDYFYLDGGNDRIDMGSGDDNVSNGNYFRYAAPGLTHIDGGGGEDELYLATLHSWSPKHGLTINLNTDKRIDLGKFQIDFKNFEDATGTSYADTITGTDGRNVLTGGGGDDIITGGRGADYLTGSYLGKDTFVYHNADNSGVGAAAHDMIEGFEHGRDLVDLSLIDPGTADHKFHFIGKRPLEHVGDLRLVEHNEIGISLDYTRVQANLDDDPHPEFEIEIDNRIDLNREDFRF